MDNLSVAHARRGESVGQQARLQGWVRTRRDSKGGFRFLELNDGSCLGNVQVVADGKLPNYESEIKHLTAGSQRHRRRRGQGVARQGPGDRGARRARHRPRLGRPRDVPAAEEGALVRVPAHDRPPAAADQHLRRHRPRAQPRLPLDPRLLPGARLPLRPHADHHRQRLRRRRRDVPRHHARPRPSCRARDDGEVDYAQDFFDQPAFLTVSGQLEGRDLRLLRWARSTRSARRSAPRTRNTSRHLAEFWMIEPEMAFFELDDNMDLAEAFLKRIFRDVLDAVRRGHAVLQRAHRQDRARHARSDRRQRLRPPALHRGGRASWRSRARRSSSRSPGATTCRPSTSAT